MDTDNGFSKDISSLLKKKKKKKKKTSSERWVFLKFRIGGNRGNKYNFRKTYHPEEVFFK